MNTEEIGERLAQARQRIHQELADLEQDLGSGLSVEVEIDWISVATHSDPYRNIPNVRLSARIR